MDHSLNVRYKTSGGKQSRNWQIIFRLDTESKIITEKKTDKLKLIKI